MCAPPSDVSDPAFPIASALCSTMSCPPFPLPPCSTISPCQIPNQHLDGPRYRLDDGRLAIEEGECLYGEGNVLENWDGARGRRQGHPLCEVIEPVYERIAGREVSVDGTVRDARSIRDLLDGECVDTVRGDDVRGG